jgi:glycosyltransferase involved in cell wall biosynthesis
LPAISVVMPVYNRAGTVRSAIDSVLAQDFSDFELLAIDDGSKDGTADAIDSIGDPRIRCLRQPQNRGGNAARNRGIREAESPLICFLDSDDEFLPHKLGFVVEFFARHPEIDVLADSFRLIYPPKTGKPPADRANPELWTSAEVEQAVFSRRLYKATPALSARKQALEEVGLFDETLKRRQDMDLILRLTRSARCAATPQVLWTKRWSADSISATQKTFAAAMIEMCERHPDYLSRPEFRIGLARDLARHFLRLLGTGHLSTVARDLRRCAGFFGWGQTARLTVTGLAEMGRRLFGRHSS